MAQFGTVALLITATATVIASLADLQVAQAGADGCRPGATVSNKQMRPAGCPPAAPPRERMDLRRDGERGSGAIRFGDTDVRIGGRASFGYGYSR